MELGGTEMARKTQISKDVILQAALDMLIRDGYSTINIKTLSKEIGCSTQPLVWHFENMEGLRRALADYALSYANKKMDPSGNDGVNAFSQVGQAYIKMALYEPYLFQFVFLNGSGCYPMGNSEMLIKDEDNAQLIKKIANEFQITEKEAGQYFQDTLIYTHGLATFVATGIMRLSEKEMMILINQASNNFLIQQGVPVNRIPQHKENLE